VKNTTKKASVAVAAGVLCLGASILHARAQQAYSGSRFQDVWAQVVSDPYSSLPHESVSVHKFFSWMRNKLMDSAFRTVSEQSDVLPRFDKLVHPNGICLRGYWNITEPSGYTGYFEQGRRGVIIARASVALSETERGNYRGFGLAGKIFPTDNPSNPARLKTANFFAIDDLGGTRAAHFMDGELTNEPAASFHPSIGIYLAGVGAASAAAFRAADVNPGRRQVYPIAELGLADKTQAVTPRWMMIRGADGPRFDQADFRDELLTALDHGPIVLDILVTEDRYQGWYKLGDIEFEAAVVSDSCDHRLHFAHPRWRSDLP